MDFENLSVEDLTALATEKRSTFDAILAEDNPPLDRVVEAEGLATEIDAIEAEVTARSEAARALADRTAALRTRFSADAEETETEADAEAEVEAAEEADEVEEAAEETAVEASAGSTVARLRGKVDRPKIVTKEPRVAITAAADVPNYASNASLSMSDVGEALVGRLKAFGRPSGRGGERVPGYQQDLRFAGVAKFALDFPEELQINRGSDDLKVLEHAGDETRLKGGSLVASGGWCAPSENLYDLCEGETLDGLVSVPEIQVNRGGINFTKGPDFGSLYNNANLGFLQTETQAEAGVEKACYEIECPNWTEVRLDAMGLCIMVPILTNAAFPELTQRTVRGALVAHAHHRNAQILTRMATIAGTPISAIDFTTSAHSTLANLEQIADVRRQQWRLGLNESMEVVLPFWVRGALRNDFALRGGRPLEAVTDAYMASEFAARNLNVQYVYDWQEIPSEVGYPASFQALMYPAGTYVVGTSDVINLNAVYDHASLVENTYTGLFFEEGLLVANKCFDANLITIPTCGSGHTGVADVDVCGVTSGTSF